MAKFPLGGFINFWSGLEGKLPKNQKLEKQPFIQDFVFINGTSVNYLINLEDQLPRLQDEPKSRYYANESVQTADDRKANEINKDFGLGVTWCSYVAGYAFGWAPMRGLQTYYKTEVNIDKTKNQTDEPKKDEIVVAKYYSLQTQVRCELDLVRGVTVTAPQKGEAGDRGDVRTYACTSLSFGVPKRLVTYDDQPLRPNGKERRGDESGKPTGGRGLSEAYFQNYIGLENYEPNKILRKIVSSFKFADDSKPNVVQPKFKQWKVAEQNLIDATLKLPPSRTTWTGTNKGLITPYNGEIIAIRMTPQERDLLFDDLL